MAATVSAESACNKPHSCGVKVGTRRINDPRTCAPFPGRLNAGTDTLSTRVEYRPLLRAESRNIINVGPPDCEAEARTAAPPDLAHARKPSQSPFLLAEGRTNEVLQARCRQKRRTATRINPTPAG